MTIGKVTGLYRYPVKSMMGESLTEARFGENGIPGDRAWAVRDEERGGIRGAKRFPELMACAASYPEAPAAEGSSPAQITLPSGDKLFTGDDNAAQRLSDVVGSPVTLWPLMPKEALDHYRRGAPLLADMEKEFRRVFGRTDDEPLPDLSAYPSEKMEFESPPGTYFDAFPVLILTEQSLSHMEKVKPDSTFAVKRFRPNILLDVEGEGLVEAAWLGKKLQIGSVTFKLEIACLRCVMATHGFDDLPKDPGVMRALVKEAGGNLGVYASVENPGEVSLEDPVTLLG
ncbi:MAG: MOSC domain-containing protein [Alphaproteobacteria bacterium]|nr:MAG: MOSC domain-containing protein [Alphaproteobacteria bacterium]